MPAQPYNLSMTPQQLRAALAVDIPALYAAGGGPGGSVNQVQLNNGSGGFAGVAAGTAGWVLTSTGAGNAPTFQAAAGGGPWTYTATDRMVGQNAGASQSGSRVFMAGTNTGQNSTVNDLILIGNGIGGTTAFTNADMAGTTVIGSLSLPGNTQSTTDKGLASGALTIVGSNNYANLLGGSRVAGAILIGSGIMPAMVGDNAGSGNYSRNIYIGNSIGRLNTINGSFGGSDNTFIGQDIGSLSSAGSKQYLHNIIIGSLAANNVSNSGNLTGNVIIGYKAGQGMASNANNTLIGDQTAQALGAGNRNVFIGSGVGPSINAGNDNILIGHQTGTTVASDTTGQFEVGTTFRSTLMWGWMASAATVLGVGNSAAADRNQMATIGGNNNLFINNGTRGVGNPTSGGFFYVSAGILHWVDTGGVDTQLSHNASGQLDASNTAYTNNAAAQTATMTNGPLAGNPTKWIPINDNGTIRNIPAW